MQDTNDFYCIGESLAIENDMATGIKFTVTATNFAAILALQRIGGKLMKTGIKY